MDADTASRVRGRLAEINDQIDHLISRRKKIESFLAEHGQSTLTGLEPDKQKESYTEAFELAWSAYATATGRREDKKAAFVKFKKLKPEEHLLLQKAINNFAQSRECKKGYSRYFVRFLKDDFWPTWINRKPEVNQDEPVNVKDTVKTFFKK